jgi:hypothetical protein
MFDLYDQAHGLQACPSAQSTRLLVVPATAHGGVAHQLLWLLARRLAREGEQVLVLDGMASEPAGTGLKALLEGKPGTPVPWPGDWTEDVVSGVHIMPGRLGLLQLGNWAHGQETGATVSRLIQALPQGVFVLLTAPVEVLAVVLQAGDLLPVLVPMAPAGRKTRGGGLPALDAPVAALSQCARTHLGVDLQIWPVAYDESRDTPADRVPEPWWFKVLDSALTVTSEVAAACLSQPPEVAAESDSRRC